MAAPDLAGVLGMRVAGERARMNDLVRLLPLALAAAEGPEAERRRGLAARIEARQSAVRDLPAAPNGWRAWHAGLVEADGLVVELVALLVTRMLREHDLGSTVFDAAEALLAELATLAGVPRVLLGQSTESEMTDRAHGSIALRFPGSRVWDLPFLAHEFGHHAPHHLRALTPEQADRRPMADVAPHVAEILGGPEPGSPASDHAEELVADAVATVCCGPSYPVACLCLRTPEQRHAADSSSTHPSWCHRVATMRATLDAMSATTGRARHRLARARVVDPLVCEVLGGLPDESEAASEAGELVVEIVHAQRPGLIYGGGDAAVAVAAALDRGDSEPPAGADVRSVLDGAWQWRLKHFGELDEQPVARLALRYCSASVEQGR